MSENLVKIFDRTGALCNFCDRLSLLNQLKNLIRHDILEIVFVQASDRALGNNACNRTFGARVQRFTACTARLRSHLVDLYIIKWETIVHFILFAIKLKMRDNLVFEVTIFNNPYSNDFLPKYSLFVAYNYYV